MGALLFLYLLACADVKCLEKTNYATFAHPTKIFFPTKGTEFLNDTDSVQDMHVDRCSIVAQSVQRQQQSCISCKGHNSSSYNDILRLLLSSKDYWNNLTPFMKVERVLLIRPTELN